MLRKLIGMVLAFLMAVLSVRSAALASAIPWLRIREGAGGLLVPASGSRRMYLRVLVRKKQLSVQPRRTTAIREVRRRCGAAGARMALPRMTPV